MNISFAAQNTNEFIHWYLSFLLIEGMYAVFIHASNLMMH